MDERTEILRTARRYLGFRDGDHSPEVDALLTALWDDGYRNSWSIAYETAKRLRVRFPGVVDV